MANSDARVLKNQQTILKNQQALLKNQKTIIANQKTITGNQAGIVANQKQIVDNQVALSGIAQTQAHILNTVKKLAGQNESLEVTSSFIKGLHAKAGKAIKKKALAATKKV